MLRFSQFQCESLLFHPGNDPDDIFRISDNQKMFTDKAVAELRFFVDEFEAGMSYDKMIEADYPVFMNAMGIQLDA